MITFNEALNQGWDDYFNNIHYNHYDFALQPMAFRWWIMGWTEAESWDKK